MATYNNKTHVDKHCNTNIHFLTLLYSLHL